jgi:tetratricopeptide (TPR) repeat protein
VLNSLRTAGLCVEKERSLDGTTQADALRLYRQGRHYAALRLPDELRKAAALFEKSHRLDPSFVNSFLALGETHMLLGMYRGAPMAESATQARLAALTALSIDPGAVCARATLGAAAALSSWDIRTATDEFQQVIRREPACPVAGLWYACTCLAPQGRFSEAIDYLQKGLTVDPAAVGPNSAVGFMHYFAGDLKSATDCARHTIDLRRRHFLGYWLLGLIQQKQGRMAESVASLRNAALFSSDAPPVFSSLTAAVAATGHCAEARAMRESLLRKRRQSYVSPLDLAQVALALGNREEALDLLAQAIEERSAWTLLLPFDGRWGPLRDDAEFCKLLAIMRARVTFPEQARSGSL